MSRPAFKLGFRNKSIPELLAICRRFIESVARVPADRSRYVPLAERQSQLAGVEAAVTQVDALRTDLRAAIAARNEQVRNLCQSVTSDACGVLNVAENKTDIVAAGLALPKPKLPKGKPAAPTFLRGQPGRKGGAVELRWKRPLRRCAFTVEFTSSPQAQAGWKVAFASTKAKCVVEGLRPGAQHWFRVCAVNAHGQGPWSSPVAVRAA